jgi:methyl coenzyme M reductase subunit D
MRVENETVNDLYYRCVQTEEALPFTYMLYNGRYVKRGSMPTYHDLTHYCPKYTTDELIAIAIGFPMDRVVADCMRDGNMGVHHCMILSLS